jgi:nucleoside-diphosphate-sugar epimerase
LIIGGTGLISRGIVTHLIARGADVTMYNRGTHGGDPFEGRVKLVAGDRFRHREFEATFARARFDVVIDMMGFGPEDAESDVRAFGGRCEHLQFCSSAAAYGVETSGQVLVDETFAGEPASAYGRNKLACEQILLRADAERRFRTTIFRPTNTYGPGRALVDQLELEPVAWDRIERGLPVLCADGGTTLWQPTHRDDCGKAFAYGALEAKTYGETYNATADQVITWREYYRQVAAALGKPLELLTLPSDWIVGQSAERFGFLRDISRFHGAYSSAKARRDIAGFRCEIEFAAGSAQVVEDMRRRGALHGGREDPLYDAMVERALTLGARVDL